MVCALRSSVPGWQFQTKRVYINPLWMEWWPSPIIYSSMSDHGTHDISPQKELFHSLQGLIWIHMEKYHQIFWVCHGQYEIHLEPYISSPIWNCPWFPVDFPLLSTINGYDSLIKVECRNPLMWVKQCHKPPLTGNGKTTTYKTGDLGDGLLLLVVIHSK